MNWESFYCPHQNCRYDGVPFYEGRMIKNGSRHGQHAQALCKACGSSVALRYGTAYEKIDADPTLFETAVRALAEGNSLRATARIVHIDKDTACAWLHRAAHHCRLVMLSFWHDLHITECQRDERWSCVHTKERNLPAAKRSHETDGDAWVGLAFAPTYRIVIAFVVGKRTQAHANLLLKRVARVTDPHIPFFTSDQLPAYHTALLHTYGIWEHPSRNGTRGRFPKPRRIPAPDLLYAHVVKTRHKGRVVNITTKLVFGTEARLMTQLAQSPVSRTVNTSFVERDNLTQRQTNRRLTRRSTGYSKELAWFEKQLWLSLAYYHFVLPHHSLRQACPLPEATHGTGSQRRWIPRTPAMAIGMTDHLWTTTELLSYRPSVQFLDTLSQLEHLFPDPDHNHQGS